jgi:hypothetical protein
MFTGAFRDPNAPLLHLTGDAVNVSILGYGATIRMRRLDYMNSVSTQPARAGIPYLSEVAGACSTYNDCHLRPVLLCAASWPLILMVFAVTCSWRG